MKRLFSALRKLSTGRGYSIEAWSKLIAIKGDSMKRKHKKKKAETTVEGLRHRAYLRDKQLKAMNYQK